MALPSRKAGKEAAPSKLGSYILPVAGRVTAGFGEASSSGGGKPTSKGQHDGTRKVKSPVRSRSPRKDQWSKKDWNYKSWGKK